MNFSNFVTRVNPYYLHQGDSIYDSTIEMKVNFESKEKDRERIYSNPSSGLLFYYREELGI